MSLHALSSNSIQFFRYKSLSRDSKSSSNMRAKQEKLFLPIPFSFAFIELIISVFVPDNRSASNQLFGAEQQKTKDGKIGRTKLSSNKEVSAVIA